MNSNNIPDYANPGQETESKSFSDLVSYWKDVTEDNGHAVEEDSRDDSEKPEKPKEKIEESSNEKSDERLDALEIDEKWRESSVIQPILGPTQQKFSFTQPTQLRMINCDGNLAKQVLQNEHMKRINMIPKKAPTPPPRPPRPSRSSHITATDVEEIFGVEKTPKVESRSFKKLLTKLFR